MGQPAVNYRQDHLEVRDAGATLATWLQMCSPNSLVSLHAKAHLLGACGQRDPTSRAKEGAQTHEFTACQSSFRGQEGWKRMRL